MSKGRSAVCIQGTLGSLLYAADEGLSDITPPQAVGAVQAEE